MHFEGVNLCVERNWPLAGRVHLGAYSHTLHRFVTSTDTVRICGYRNNPPLFGRIIKTSDDIESVRASGVPLHPDLEILLLNPSPDSPENPPVLLKMQWIILKTQSLALDEHAAWTIHDFDTLLATGDLPEAAHTNCTAWVAADQVCAFVPVPHKDDCVNHTYDATDAGGTHYSPVQRPHSISAATIPSNTWQQRIMMHSVRGRNEPHLHSSMKQRSKLKYPPLFQDKEGNASRRWARLAACRV